ncbi:hypothetical protein ACWECC_39435, partial [Streptomyces microflavus]
MAARSTTVGTPESSIRRPFSYHDGISEDGTPDAGLLFVCWQADPFQ